MRKFFLLFVILITFSGFFGCGEDELPPIRVENNTDEEVNIRFKQGTDPYYALKGQNLPHASRGGFGMDFEDVNGDNVKDIASAEYKLRLYISGSSDPDFDGVTNYAFIDLLPNDYSTDADFFIIKGTHYLLVSTRDDNSPIKCFEFLKWGQEWDAAHCTSDPFENSCLSDVTSDLFSEALQGTQGPIQATDIGIVPLPDVEDEYTTAVATANGKFAAGKLHAKNANNDSIPNHFYYYDPGLETFVEPGPPWLPASHAENSADIEFVDFDSDGKDDALLVGNFGTDEPEPNRLYRIDMDSGAGEWEDVYPTEFPHQHQTIAVEAADIDGLYYTDLVILNHQDESNPLSDHTVQVFRVYPQPGGLYALELSSVSLSHKRVFDVGVEKLNADNTFDLIVAGGITHYLYNNGTDSYGNWQGFSDPAYLDEHKGDFVEMVYCSTTVGITDLTSSDKAFILGNGDEQNRLFVKLQGHEHYEDYTMSPDWFPADGGMTLAAAMEDLNSDGCPDIVVGNGQKGGALCVHCENFIYLTDEFGKSEPECGHFTNVLGAWDEQDEQIPDDGTNTTSVVITDIDYDGCPDIFVGIDGDGTGNPNRVYLNKFEKGRCVGQFDRVPDEHLPSQLRSPTSRSYVSAIDDDKDGKAEALVVTNFSKTGTYNGIRDYVCDIPQPSGGIPPSSSCYEVKVSDLRRSLDQAVFADMDRDPEANDDEMVVMRCNLFSTECKIEIIKPNAGKYNYNGKITYISSNSGFLGATSLEVADFDGNDFPDIFVGTGNCGNYETGRGQNKLILNYGTYFSECENCLPNDPVVDMDNTMDAKAADVDGDADMDMIVSNLDTRTLRGYSDRILINDGRGVFTDDTQSFLDFESGQTAYPDLNATGPLVQWHEHWVIAIYPPVSVLGDRPDYIFLGADGQNNVLRLEEPSP